MSKYCGNPWPSGRGGHPNSQAPRYIPPTAECPPVFLLSEASIVFERHSQAKQESAQNIETQKIRHHSIRPSAVEDLEAGGGLPGSRENAAGRIQHRSAPVHPLRPAAPSAAQPPPAPPLAHPCRRCRRRHCRHCRRPRSERRRRRGRTAPAASRAPQMLVDMGSKLVCAL